VDKAESTEGLREIIEANWDKRLVPGFAVGVTQGDEEIHLGFGETSVEAPLPVTADTLFQIGSITKTFTSLALLSYIEAGRFQLDAPVREYLADFRVADEQVSQQVTIRHLLTHTGGWAGDFFVDTGRGDDALAQYVAQMADLPQIGPIGQHFSYNNAGFNVAGRLLEIASGKTYEAALSERVLEPLGLGHSYFEAADVISHRFAVGHHLGDRGLKAARGSKVARPWALPRCGHPVGGIATSVRDLMRYSAYYLAEGQTATGQRLLGSEMLGAMMSPQQRIWRNKEAVGFSWLIDDVQGERLLFHFGSTNGQLAGLYLVPAKQFAVAVLTNSSQGEPLMRAVSLWALERYAGVRLGDHHGQVDELEHKPPDYRALTGKYARPFAEVTLGVDDGRLWANMRYKGGFPTPDDPPPPNPPLMELGAVETDRFLILNGPSKSSPMDIIRKADGSIGWLRASKRLHTKVAGGVLD
jgi:CubicO group peptidase (beta-lactamase class C family)